MPDSSTIANVGAFLSSVSPSWSMVVLLVAVLLLYPLGTLIRNSKVVEAIVKYFEVHNQMATTVQEIRADQKQSNLERQEQSTAIDHIDKRLATLETKVEQLSCSNSPNCVNRNVRKVE